MHGRAAEADRNARAGRRRQMGIYPRIPRRNARVGGGGGQGCAGGAAETDRDALAGGRRAGGTRRNARAAAETDRDARVGGGGG